MKSIARQRSEIADFQAEHFDQDELLGHVSLISLLCFSSSPLRSDGSILRTSHLKTCFATNSFASKEPAFNPPPLLLYELSCSNGSSRALRVMFKVHCASAQRNRSEQSIGPCLRPQIMEIFNFSSCEQIYPAGDLRAEHFNQYKLLG